MSIQNKIEKLKKKIGKVSALEGKRILAIIAIMVSLSTSVPAIANEINCTIDGDGEIHFFSDGPSSPAAQPTEAPTEVPTPEPTATPRPTQVPTVTPVPTTIPMVTESPVPTATVASNYDLSTYNNVLGGYVDVNDDNQVYSRAQIIFNQIQTLNDASLSTFTVEEIANYIMIIGGRNPYNRTLEFSDINFMVNRLYTLMNSDYLNCARYLRGFEPNYSIKPNIDFSLFIADNKIGKNITNSIEADRHGMLNNPTYEGGYPYAYHLTETALNSFLWNGFNGFQSHHDAETSGIRLFNIIYLFNTADLAASVASANPEINNFKIDAEAVKAELKSKGIMQITSLNGTVLNVDNLSYDNIKELYFSGLLDQYTLVALSTNIKINVDTYLDGQYVTCVWPLDKIIAELNDPNCPETAADFNYMTEATYGVLGEINHTSYTLK